MSHSGLEGGWLRDTRFGGWFQRTRVWQRYVVEYAFDEFARLLDPQRLHPATMLDAGCGAGQAFALIRARFAPDRLVAVDVDPRQLAHAERAAGLGPDVELVCADLRELPIADASIDAILCHQTLHHTCDQAAVLREMLRVLRPGGTLLLAESCRRFIRSLPVRLLFRHPMQVQRSPDDYLRLLEAAGFALDEGRISTPDPAWSRPDFGLRPRLGLPPRAAAEPAELQVVAYRPQRAAH